MAARKAASVLPEPVGDAIRVLRPAMIDGQARSCGSVGVPKRPVNQPATAGWKVDKGMAVIGGRWRRAAEWLPLPLSLTPGGGPGFRRRKGRGAPGRRSEPAVPAHRDRLPHP